MFLPTPFTPVLKRENVEADSLGLDEGMNTGMDWLPPSMRGLHVDYDLLMFLESPEPAVIVFWLRLLFGDLSLAD